MNLKSAEKFPFAVFTMYYVFMLFYKLFVRVVCNEIYIYRKKLSYS
jgi:hypothetical protein